MKYEEIKRGSITYYLIDSAVVVSIGGYQYISYNMYNTPNRSSISEFKKKLKKSRPNQYTTASEQMDLAIKCKLVGSGIRKPDWIKWCLKVVVIHIVINNRMKYGNWRFK